MEEADKLCEQLFLWLEKQEQCIGELLALAEELENLHRGSNIVQAVGNAAAVGGFAALAIICTGGLAAPLAGPMAVAGIGTVVSLTPKAIESGVSLHTVNKAKKLIEEVEKIQDTIQTLLNKLSAKCSSQALGASAASSDDESDECEVTTQIMGALARRFGIDVPLELLRRFNKTTIFNQQRLVRPDHDVALPLINTGAVFLMLNMGLKVVGKDVGFIGMKTVIKHTVLAAGSLAGTALSIHDLVVNIKEIIDNRTEASRSLRTAAREMKENTKNLRKKIGALQEIIKKFSKFRSLLKDLGRYSLDMTEAGLEFLDLIKATCHDDTILSWVVKNWAAVLNLFRFIRDTLLKLLEKKEEEENRRHVHIVFVAHGSITDKFMPASLLVPPPSIIDTILYSPWNCGIDACAASGIAAGCIEPHHRRFYNVKTRSKLKNVLVPPRWNSMRESMLNMVPQIILWPVTPDELVWTTFVELGGYVCRGNRIIIPYLQPSKEAPPIPFFMLIFVTSYMLFIKRVKATVHLAACLGRGETKPMWEEWAAQYAFTEDETTMYIKKKVLNLDPSLLQAFRLMFDNQQ